MTVGDQVGRIVGAPARLDRDAPERRHRRGDRPLAASGPTPRAEQDRLRARRTSRRCATSTRPSRSSRSSSARTTARSSTRSTSARCSSRSATSSSRPARSRTSSRSSARAHEVGAHVILDATSRPASSRSTSRRSSVDFAVGGSVKWLCGGPGNGWLYVRPDLAERLEPTFTGWQAHERAVRLRGGDASTPTGAARFLTGTPNVPALYAGDGGLRPDRGDRRRADPRRTRSGRPQLLIDLADEAGLRGAEPRASPSAAAARSRSTSPTSPPSTRELAEREILCDFRPDAGLRLGPHFYTSDDELRLVVEQIGEILETGAHRRHLGVVAQH